MGTEESNNLLEDPVVKLLLQGCASTAAEAERLYIEEHFNEIVPLVNSNLSDEEFRRQPLIAALLSHGSRGCDDSPL